MHIVWITAGLGCDGDSVSITAATQPSIEDVLLGAIPGLPKVHLHNPVLAYENGSDFLNFYYLAEQGKLDPFVLVVEGSIPNEKIKKRGLLGGGRDKTLTRVNRLRPTNGSTVLARRRSPSWAAEHVLPMVAFTLWRVIPPAPWGCGLSRMGLEVQGGTSDRECSWLSGPAGQLHGNCAVPALSSRRTCSDDSAR